MTRPIYERASNREDQRRLIGIYARYRGLIADEARPLTAYDYMMFDDWRPAEIVEVKKRRNKRLAYPDYLISKTKVVTLKCIASDWLVDPIVLVGWSDCVGYARLSNDLKYRVSRGGRTDRNDAADIENCAFLPISAFSVIWSF